MELSEEELSYLRAHHEPGTTDLGDIMGRNIRRWHDIVNEVTLGYNDDVIEYTNDLMFRANLGDLINGGPASLRDKLYPLLRAIDVGFLESTIILEKPLMEFEDRTGLDIWHRIPKEPSLILKKWLIRGGQLSS